MPKLIDHRQREVEVAEAAWRVLERDGVRGLSVRTVAEEAGLAVGSLRRSFPSQFSLLAFCVRLVDERCAARVAARVQSWDADQPVAAGRAVLEEVLPFDADRRLESQVWLALSIEALSDPDLRRVCDGIDENLQRLVAGVAEHVAGKPVPTTVSAELHAVVDGLVLHMLRQEEGSLEWAREVLTTALERLRA